MQRKVWAVTVLASFMAMGAHAQEQRTLYLQGGVAERSAYATTVGVTLPWQSWAWQLGSGQVTGQWDAYWSNWSSRPAQASRRNTWMLGIGPSLRWRGEQGQSPWFVEAGTGIHYANRRYRTGSDEFGTRYNFSSHLGVGRNFGAQRTHEVSLRIQHSSNAGIKKPNPGENFLLLRYAHPF